MNSQKFNKHLLLDTESFRRTLWKIKPKWKWKVLFTSLNCNFQNGSARGIDWFCFEIKPKSQLKVLFIFIELRLSKKIDKRANLAWAVKTKSKLQLKVLFIFVELRLSKKMWKQSQNDSWKFFSFSLNCNFQKRSLKKGQSDLDFKDCWKSFSFHWIATFKKDRQPGLGCENKVKMTVESPFHFHWVSTFRWDH